jgi:hypothetical protein
MTKFQTLIIQKINLISFLEIITNKPRLYHKLIALNTYFCSISNIKTKVLNRLFLVKTSRKKHKIEKSMVRKTNTKNIFLKPELNFILILKTNFRKESKV